MTDLDPDACVRDAVALVATAIDIRERPEAAMAAALDLERPRDGESLSDCLLRVAYTVTVLAMIARTAGETKDRLVGDPPGTSLQRFAVLHAAQAE